MSQYEEALKIQARNAQVIMALKRQVTDSHRDKTGLHWEFGQVGDRCMTFRTDCYSGYYGSSSVSSDNSPELGREIAKTLSKLKGSIIGMTVSRLEAETAEAMKLARAEAQRVLDACQT